MQEIQQERLCLQSDQLPEGEPPEASNSKQQIAEAKILIVAQEVCNHLSPPVCAVTQPSFQSET